MQGPYPVKGGSTTNSDRGEEVGRKKNMPFSADKHASTNVSRGEAMTHC